MVEAQVGTRSVLFTDLVGSTELRVQLGEEAADNLRRAHDALLAEAVTAHGGTVVKGLGDGIMASFDSAADGVAAAVAAQQAVAAHSRRHPDQAFSVRVGLSIGDVSTEAGDVFGVPVVEASRLCASATGGEILAADLVRALARGRGGFTFEPMGDIDFKGLAEPVPACRVLWQPLFDLDGDRRERVPISAALIGATTAYVGREILREELNREWDDVQGGTCRTVLLAGEPGVGKTHTAAELAHTAFSDGAVVLFGRCDEGLGAPYQPFVEALEHYVTHCESPVLGRLAGELRRMVPDLGPTVAATDQPVASDPASEEHRLFEACTSWLVEMSRDEHGCVLVLDDLHWATKPTLQLLQHVVRGVTEQGAPLLVLATYRDTDIDRAHPLAAAIGDLRRLTGVTRVAVDNLSAAEVVDFIAAAAGHDLDEPTRRLADAVYAETEGNPFFVGEVLRHLVETGGVRREGERWSVTDPDAVTVPEGVRDVVGRRLDRLSSTANDLLSIAAVLGRDFDIEVLTALVDASDAAALDALDQAVRARLIEETGIDRFRFAHALVRTTLYEELSATRRRRLHRGVADALEKLRPHDVRALAHHCIEAGPDGTDFSRALRYSLAAAEEALGARAFAEASARFRTALELLDDADQAGSAPWVAAMSGLGEALRDEGDGSFREVLLAASRRALELGNVDLVVRAVLANTRGLAAVVSSVDRAQVDLIEEALALVGDAPSPARARLLGQLASELTFSGQHDRRVALADDAVGMARALDDERLLCEVIVNTGYAAITGSRLRQLTDRTAEGVRLADRTGDPALRVISRLFDSGALVATGQIGESNRVARQAVAIADTEGSPLLRWITSVTAIRLELLRGDPRRAPELNDQLITTGAELGQPDGAQWWAAGAAGMAWLTGEAGALADAAGEMVEQYPGAPAWRCSHAWLLCEAGRLAETRRGSAHEPPDTRRRRRRTLSPRDVLPARDCGGRTGRRCPRRADHRDARRAPRIVGPLLLHRARPDRVGARPRRHRDRRARPSRRRPRHCAVTPARTGRPVQRAPTPDRPGPRPRASRRARRR